MSEKTYAIWDVTWDDYWLLYELGEADDGFYCRCMEVHSGEVLALGLGDSAVEALSRALTELLELAREEAA